LTASLAEAVGAELTPERYGPRPAGVAIAAGDPEQALEAAAYLELPPD
jgi:hypothetical protein